MEQVAPWRNTEITAYDSKSFMYRQSRWQHNNLSNLLIITQQCLRPPRRTCQKQLYLCCCCCSRCRLMSQFSPKPHLLRCRRWRKRRVWVTLFVIFVVVIIIDLVVAASGVLVIDFCLVPVRCSVVAPGANNSAEIHRHTHTHTQMPQTLLSRPLRVPPAVVPFPVLVYCLFLYFVGSSNRAAAGDAAATPASGYDVHRLSESSHWERIDYLVSGGAVTLMGSVGCLQSQQGRRRTIIPMYVCVYVYT